MFHCDCNIFNFIWSVWMMEKGAAILIFFFFIFHKICVCLRMCMNTCTVSCFIYLSRNKLTVVKIVLFFLSYACKGSFKCWLSKWTCFNAILDLYYVVAKCMLIYKQSHAIAANNFQIFDKFNISYDVK